MCGSLIVDGEGKLTGVPRGEKDRQCQHYNLFGVETRLQYFGKWLSCPRIGGRQRQSYLGKSEIFTLSKCQFPHLWGLLRVKYSPQNDHSANKRNHSQYFYSKFGKPWKNLVHVKITT